MEKKSKKIKRYRIRRRMDDEGIEAYSWSSQYGQKVVGLYTILIVYRRDFLPIPTRSAVRTYLAQFPRRPFCVLFYRVRSSLEDIYHKPWTRCMYCPWAFKNYVTKSVYEIYVQFCICCISDLFFTSTCTLYVTWYLWTKCLFCFFTLKGQGHEIWFG